MFCPPLQTPSLALYWMRSTIGLSCVKLSQEQSDMHSVFEHSNETDFRLFKFASAAGMIMFVRFTYWKSIFLVINELMKCSEKLASLIWFTSIRVVDSIPLPSAQNSDMLFTIASVSHLTSMDPKFCIYYNNCTDFFETSAMKLPRILESANNINRRILNQISWCKYLLTFIANSIAT